MNTDLLQRARPERTRRGFAVLVTAVAAIALALALGTAVPAAAHPEHTSCKGFGEFFADYAQGGYEDEYDLENPGLSPFATMGPGVIAANVEDEHELYCQS